MCRRAFRRRVRKVRKTNRDSLTILGSYRIPCSESLVFVVTVERQNRKAKLFQSEFISEKTYNSYSANIKFAQ